MPPVAAWPPSSPAGWSSWSWRSRSRGARTRDLPRAGWPFAAPDEAVTIVDAGATPRLVGDARSVGLWAQAENLGPALADTRIVFTVFAPDGRAIWSGWFDDVDWQAGERRRSTIDWDISKAPASDYRVGVAVESKDGTVVYAPLHDAGVVHVAR